MGRNFNKTVKSLIMIIIFIMICSISKTVFAASSKKRTLKYNANGGKGAPASQTYYNTDSKIKISSIIPTRKNYTFLGWHKNKNAGVDAKSFFEANKEYTLSDEWKNKNQTVYAIWMKTKVNTLRYYSYDPSDTKTLKALDYQNYSSDKDIKFWTANTVHAKKENAELIGWSTSTTATRAQFKPGVTYQLSYNWKRYDQKVYAVWKYNARKLGLTEAYIQEFKKYNSKEQKNPWTTKAKYAYEELIKAGATHQGAAGVLGNITQECRWNENKVTNEHYGLCQWGGDRLVALKKFAKDKGKDYTDYKTQIDFMIYELKNNKMYSESWRVISKTNDVVKASDIIMKNYERPGNTEGLRDVRRGFSVLWFNYLEELQKLEDM